MKEPSCIAFNFGASFFDESSTPTPLVEVILVTTEPQYNAAGEKARVAETFRFGVVPKTLRHLAGKMTDAADAADKLFEAAFVGKETK